MSEQLVDGTIRSFDEVVAMMHYRDKQIAELEGENAQQAATIAAIEKWVIRNKCFVSVEAFRENMQHRAALTKEEL